jgi:hypothetical protein
LWEITKLSLVKKLKYYYEWFSQMWRIWSAEHT